MLNNYADSGGGFNSNHGQAARPTETQKQQNLGASWSYNSQLEGIYYGSEHQPMYMGAYEGNTKHASYSQYSSGTIHQPVPAPVVQCHEACCQHYENRYPINPAPLRYQPTGPLQPRYPDIPNTDSRQYIPDKRSVQVNLSRKKVYPTENGYSGISDRHYSQYMGRGQTLPIDSRQQMQVMRPQYPAYPHYWGNSRGWTGARMNCPPPSYHQSVNQSAQLQPGTKITDSSQYMDPSLQKSLSATHQRGSFSNGKLDIIRPVPEPKRPALDSSLQSCYEYGYPTGFLPFSEVNKAQGKSLNPQSMNASCKIPAEKQYHPQQLQYSYQNNDRNLISYGNPSNDPSYTMNFPLSSNDLHSRSNIEDEQQASASRKLAMHYDSSGKKRQDLDLRQYLATWEDDEDESARLSEPPLPIGNTTTPYIVVECSTLESETAAKLQERFKPLPPSQDCSTKPRGSSPSSEHKRPNEPPRQERTERTIIHSDLHSQTNYAPSMPTLLSDSDKNVNFWNGINKEGDHVMGKGGAFQPLDCSKRDGNMNPKTVSQSDSLPSRDVPTQKVLCSSDPNSSFDALVSFYGDSRRVSGGYDLVEMSERLINSSDKAHSDHQSSAVLARPSDPRLQQSQLENNPSIYDKLSPRFSTNNFQDFKGVPTDPYYNSYKHPMPSGQKYYGYENTPIINPNYDYKFVSDFDNTRLYGNKEAPTDPRKVLYADSQKNPENTIIEPLIKSSIPNCFQEKPSLEYTSLEPEQFMSPIIVKSTNSLSEPCSQKSNTIEDSIHQQKTTFSNVLSSSGMETPIQPEKTDLITSQNNPPEIFSMSYSPKKEMAHSDNVVTLHSGDQTKNNTITVEVPYVQQYSTLVKLSEEIRITESVDENEVRSSELTQEGKTTTEEIKKPTCFKLKRLPNSKEWTVEGNEIIGSSEKESIHSPISSDVIVDSDILKSSVSVSNLNMPSLDDIRDGEENCEVNIGNNPKTKVSEGVLSSNKTSSQPPQLAIVQPMKLVNCESESSDNSLQRELSNEETKSKQDLNEFRSFHSHSLNETSFSNDKPVTDTGCDSQIEDIKTDISKHENFRSHKKIQGNFSNTFPNCLSPPNEEFSHSQDNNSEGAKQQYSPFHMYTDCEVNSQIPDFFKMDRRSPSNKKSLDKQMPTSPGVEGMFEDINHSTNNQLCHNQIYHRKSCNFQDLTGPSMSSFDNHNSHFQSFSSIFADDSNNKGRCDGSVLQIGDKKYLKHLLDDIERQQVSNTLEERVSKLKSNFLIERSNNKACDAKKSPPIPPINLKLSESKKVWCITNKDQHLSLSDLSENSSLSLASKSSTTEKRTSLKDNKIDQEQFLMEISTNETNQSCYKSDDILPLPDKKLSDIGNRDKTEKEPILMNELSSETVDKVGTLSEHTTISKDIDTTSAQISSISSINLTKKLLSNGTSHLVTEFNDTTKICSLYPQIKQENHCLSIVKYYPRHEILKGSLCDNTECNISQNILMFDEKGTHFPQGIYDEDSQYMDSKSVANDIVELLITNVFSREIVDSPGNELVLVPQDKLTVQDNVNSIPEENLETVIKFDKSSNSSKSANKQKNISKTTEIFIEREKEHNQLSSVIKAIQLEKYLGCLDERKILVRSIFSPMPDDTTVSNSICSYISRPSVTNNIVEEKNIFNFYLSETLENSDKMDVDAIENNDENQPLDYSLGDVVNHKTTLSLNGSTFENVTFCGGSKDSSNIDGKVFNEQGNINCSGGFGVSSNLNRMTENNNSELFSIERVDNSSCSKNQHQQIDTNLPFDTELMNKEVKNSNQSTDFNCENSAVEDSCSSEKSNFERDFDISDSEPTNEKETIAKEAISFMEVNLSDEKVGSNCISIKEQLLPVCCNKQKESATDPIQMLKTDPLLPEELSIVPAIFTKDIHVNGSVEQNSKSTNQTGKLPTMESPLLNCDLKNSNPLKIKESYCFQYTEKSLGNKSENPRDYHPLNNSKHKVKELFTAKSGYNCYNKDEGSIPKFHVDERSETSVIVRNNTFPSITNHCNEQSSNYFDKIESNVKTKGNFLTNKPKSVNKETLINVKEKCFENIIPKSTYKSLSHQCSLITKVSIDESNIYSKANEDESMVIESPNTLKNSVIPTLELNSVKTFPATKSFEEGTNNLKLCYCVSESIFLNIDEESVLCLEKSSSSYLFDFKRRKLLKFCKSVNEPQFSLNKNCTNYSRDFSIINFGLNVSQQVCSSNAVTNDLTYPIFERSHCESAETEVNNKIQELADEVCSTPLFTCKENTEDPPETFDTLYTTDESKETTVTKFKDGQSEEEQSAVLKPNKSTVVLRSKLYLPQEENSFCIRRDSLKILEPEAVLKEIFSPDPDMEDSESKENYFSANHAKDKLNSSNNLDKFSLAPITCTSLLPYHNDSSVENKWNQIHSSSQTFADVNCNLLNSIDKDSPFVNSETNYKAQTTSRDVKDELKSLSNSSKTRDNFKQNICKEQFSFVGADMLDGKTSVVDKQSSLTPSLKDCISLDISSKLLSKNDSESSVCPTDNLTHSNQISLLYNSKLDECSDQSSAVSKLHNENNYGNEFSKFKTKNSEETLTHEEQRTTESLTRSVSQDVQTLSCQISNLGNHISNPNSSEKTVSSMAIVTGKDVLFSSRFLEDEEDKELNSELQTENRSRKSSVEEESILDCQSMKMNSQDSLRGGGNLNSDSFPLQCLAEAAFALENVDSKQMLLNSPSFLGVNSQSSQILIKSTIEDVHPNDIEDFPETNSLSRSNSETNVCKDNSLSTADQEIFSKFEENNYNLRASTRIVTSSSSNIIPYSKRYYKLKRQKLPKPTLDKIIKTETTIVKSQTKKRKDVFTYPRSKRRKKGIKEKVKYQKLKKQQDFHKKCCRNSCVQISSTDDSTQKCEKVVVFENPSSSSNNKHEEKEDCFQSLDTKRSAENYNLGSHQSLLEKSNFGGPLIIASENSPAESNIFCVHVNSDRRDDEYVHDLNVGALELLLEHNQSNFKENSIGEQSDSASLVIVIDELGDDGDKGNYYNLPKGDSDIILGSIEERSPLPQPNSILDYCSDNLTCEVSLNESCICPSDLGHERNCGHNLFKDSKSLEPKSSISFKSYEIDSVKLESYENYSSQCNQELLITNCYEEINETLVNDIDNWPFVEEEVAEFNTKSVSPNRIPEEGRKIELKCSLPWNKIFNMTKTKNKKNETSNKVSGLELGPAKVEVRLRAPSTEWKVISDYSENSSPVVKVSRLILQRESETSSYSEKDSEEENENRKLLSPLSEISEFKDNSDSNNISINLIENEIWQPVVLLTRDKELDELTLSRNRLKELDDVRQSKTGGKELVEFELTLESQFLSEQSNYTCFSGQHNEDLKKDHSGRESSNERIVDCNLSKYSRSIGNLQTSFESEETDHLNCFPGKKNVARYQNTKTEKVCSYETYSPSRHGGSQADDIIYSPSDPHYSPEPGYVNSDSSSFGDKKKGDMGESDASEYLGSYNTFNVGTFNKESDILRTGCFRSNSSLFSGTPENVNFLESETSDTHYSSETQTSSLFDTSRNYLVETNALSDGDVHHMNNHYVRPDLLDTPNIISNETRKSDLKKSVAEENLRKFKRKMPKNFFVRRKFKKNTGHENNVITKMLLEEKQNEGNPACSLFLPDDNLIPSSTEFVSKQQKSLNSSVMKSTSSEWQTVQNSAPIEERLSNTKSDLPFACKNSCVPSLDDLKSSYSVGANDSPKAERFEEKLRLRDGGRGLKRPCEGHSKEDTKRRRKNPTNYSSKCQECDVQFETKEQLSRHMAQDHVATQELHHCLLCQRSFSSQTRHRLHMQGRSHRHLELTQRHTIHAVHRLLAGEDCPRIPSLSQTELQALQWRPTQSGYSHFYYQLTPLQTVLQENNAEASAEMVAGEGRTLND